MTLLLVGLGRWGDKHLRVLRELGEDLWVADSRLPGGPGPNSRAFRQGAW
jgi:hypothetical protein